LFADHKSPPRGFLINMAFNINLISVRWAC